MRMIRITGRTKEVTKKPTWKPVRLYPARSKAQIIELPEISENQKWVCCDNDVDNNDSGGSTKTACNQGGDMETDSNAIDRYRSRSRSRPPWVSGQTWPPQGQGEESSRGSVPGSLCNILLQLQGASISLLYCDLGDTDHIIITDPSLCSDICLQAFCDHSNILISFLLSRTGES